MIDSHCHLQYKGIVEQQADVLDRAREAGVRGFLNISTKRSEWTDVTATASRERDVWASVGIHPHEADAHTDLTEDALYDAASQTHVIGIGETGLDYYYEHSDREAQKELFRRHISVARKLSLPVIIHARDAEEDTLEILDDEMGKGVFPALIHCFTASQGFGDEVLRLGLSISISGIVTFKNAKDLQAVAKTIPKDRLLIETDSPFLAPVPKRGKTCEPAYVAHTAAFLADLRGEPVDALTDYTTSNFFSLFSKAAA
ncbi:TatD family hydrolase [Qipengyuania atrilutea]|uniref:TatD family hydrolase n=1 Tax=Qipengyuania atrilutea TaxID=2744473 RepID=A0A850GW94_9SPHN|nr:TatD family hydrolase [Actirhodobacter atriluteus]NVD43824.1 TatD family hydrolase [Actirhodobacter atriluteus]